MLSASATVAADGLAPAVRCDLQRDPDAKLGDDGQALAVLPRGQECVPRAEEHVDPQCLQPAGGVRLAQGLKRRWGFNYVKISIWLVRWQSRIN